MGNALSSKVSDFCVEKNINVFREKHPSGDYPMQRMVEDGLSHWAAQNRNIYDTNIVVWFNFGILHVKNHLK